MIAEWTASHFRKCLASVVLALGGFAAATAQGEILPPENLTALPVHGRRIDVSWQQPSSSGADGYRVARKCGAGDDDGYCLLADLGAQARSYRDVDVTAGTTYDYRVEAVAGGQKAAAYAATKTWSPTRLPRDESSTPDGPIYFEPQAAWSLGAAASLSNIKTVRIGHNLRSDEELGVLLKPAIPVDPKAPCRQRSLLGRLSLADFETEKLSAPSQMPRRQTAEIYFYDLSQKSESDGFPREMIPEFEAMGEEGYALRAEFTDSDALRIWVGAKTPRGLFRGGMTVQRLLVDDSLCAPRETLEPVLVLDYPDHSFRGTSPDWRPMTANYVYVPELSLDMLDSLARSGATEVEWGNDWAAQDAFSWDKTGARAAAAVQIAAAERFMTVKYWMGTSGITFGTRDGGSDGGHPKAEFSLAQSVYGDGLGVVDEPFSWVETRPGQFEARAQRAGRLLDRDPDMHEVPWVPDDCRWTQVSSIGSGPAHGVDWRLQGPARKCGLSRFVAGFAAAEGLASRAPRPKLWIKASGDAVEVFVRVGLEVSMGDGTTVLTPAESSQRVPVRNGRWSEYAWAPSEKATRIDWEGVRSARWVVEASLADGSIRVRDESPWRAEDCGPSVSWRFDTGPGREGKQSSSWRLDGPATDCALSQVLDTMPRLGHSRYSLSAWIRSSHDAVDVSGSLALELDTAKGIRRFPVAFSTNSADDEWSRISLDIPDLASSGTIRSARLAVRGSLGAGTIWLDSVALYARSLAPFSLGDEPRASAWSFSSDGSGLGWDEETGRTDGGSFKVEIPMTSNKGRGAQLATLYQDVSLQAGRYLLGAWVKVRPAGGEGGASVPFSLRGDVNLFLFDQAAGESHEGAGRVDAEYLNLPKTIETGSEGWSYSSHIFDLSPQQAQRVRSLRLQVRVFPSATAGEYWLDDIQLRRLDGDLHNLLGAVKPPQLKRPSGELYEEGVDYVVCQVGVDGSECATPQNYTERLKGGLTSTYDESRMPFEIRWLRDEAPAEADFLMSYDIGAQYETVSGPAVSWDGQVYTAGSLNFCDFKKVASGIGLDAIFGRFLDGYTIENFPEYGQDYEFKADVVTWSVSEVRGINRSVACLGPQQNSRPSNAALFAEVVNEAVSLAKTKAPQVRFALWADMFNPFTNGGDIDYQLRYGGVAGRSACAYAPTKLASMCADEVQNVPRPIIENEALWGEGPIMQPWSYFPNMIRRMVAISSWYEGLGVSSQVLSGSDQVNVEDWASIAHTFGEIQGGVSNGYHAKLYGGRSGVLPGLQAFWNHDWRLLYLHDNETEQSSFYQIAWPFEVTSQLRQVKPDLTGACATMPSKFDGNNDGGLCLEATRGEDVPRIDLGGVPVRGGARYRIDVLARRHPARRAAIDSETPKIAVRWSSGESTASLSSTPVYDAKKRPRGDGFDRYRVEFKAPESAQDMEIEIEFPVEGGFSAADDIVVFESVLPCFDDCSDRS